MDPTPLLLALGVAALLCALGWRPWARGGVAAVGPATGPWASALLPAALFLATWYGIERGLPAHPPKVATDHVFRALVLATVPGWLLARRGGPDGGPSGGGSRVRVLVGALLLAALVGACAWTALAVYRERHWADARGDLRVAGLAVAWGLGALLFAATPPAAGRPARASEGLALLAVSAATAVAAGFSSLTTALLLGGQAVGLGGLWVAGLWRPGWPTLAAWRGPWAVAHGGLLLNAVLFGSLPATAGGLLAVAPLVPGTLGRPLARRGAGRWGTLVTWGVLALLLALAVWLAWPEPDPYGDLYGGLPRALGAAG